MSRTVVLGVLLDSEIEEGGVEPVQSYGDVGDGVQHYLCIEMFYEVAMEAERDGREEGGMGGEKYL